MNKALLLALCFFIVSSTLLSFIVRTGGSSLDEPILEWDRAYGGKEDDVAWSVVQTSDGGYAIAGWTGSFGAGSEDFWLVKTDADGKMEWNKTYGGASTAWYGERAYCIIQTSDGGYAIAGEASSFDAGNRDFWLVKTSVNGNMEWNKTYGGTDQEEAYSVIQTSDGGYALAGRTLSFGVVGYENMWLVKTDSNGNMQWNKAYGGAGIEIAYSVVQTSDSGYAIGGETGSGGNDRDILLVKTDPTGNMIWQKTYGLPYPISELSTSLILTTDGGFALAGWRENPVGTEHGDFYLVKTDRDGNMQWNKTYGGETGEFCWDAIQTSDGGYLLTGGTNWPSAPDLWLVKTDANGNMEWNQTYDGAGSEWAYSVIQTIDGGYAIAGFTSSSGTGGRDFWLIRLAPPRIAATIDIDPDTLNVKSNGKWVTVYIELPLGHGYDVSMINLTSIMLNGQVYADAKPFEIGDYDCDGIPDLMVKFNRAAVQAILQVGDQVQITISGRLIDDRLFEGKDIIKVILPP